MNSSFIYYGLTIIALIISSLAQGFVSGSYSKYSKVKNKKGINGKEAARNLLDKHTLNNISVEETSGYLTDHYDPAGKVIRLSEGIYIDDSIASVSVACHECGHAIQDKEGYMFMRIRSSIVPIVNLSSYAGYVAILLGCLFSAVGLIKIGVIAECIVLLFQVVTLPVEIDAPKRALKELESMNILDNEEMKKAKIMLGAAALTYVASVLTTLIQILRLVLMFRRNDD